MQVRELRTMSINVPWLEVLKACYPNAQVMIITMVMIMIVMIMIVMNMMLMLVMTTTIMMMTMMMMMVVRTDIYGRRKELLAHP